MEPSNDGQLLSPATLPLLSPDATQAPLDSWQPKMQQPADPNAIPMLLSTASSIFVPLSADLLSTAAAPPATRAGRIKATLAQLDSHAMQVRQNLLHLVRRECIRIAHCADDHQTETALDSCQSNACEANPPPGILQPDDWAELAANLEGAYDRDKNYDVVLPTADFSHTAVNNSTQWLTREVMATLLRLLDELRGLDTHINHHRTLYEEALRREAERESSLAQIPASSSTGLQQSTPSQQSISLEQPNPDGTVGPSLTRSVSDGP